jgi:hypothetical protein
VHSRHAAVDAERLRTGAGVHDLFAPSNLADQRQRRVLNW